MDVREALAARHRLRKVLIATAVFFVVFTVAGFLLVPPLLKSYLTKELSTALHRDVTIGEISCNPYVLSLNVKDLTIGDRDKGKTFFSFRNLYVNLQSISLVKWGIVIRDLRLDGVYARIVRNADGTYNFSDLLVKEKGKASKEPEPPRFSVNNIQVLDGAVDFHDGPKGASHEVRNLRLTIPFLSNLPYHVDTYVQPSLEATLNGDTVFFRGRTKPFKDSLETSFDVKVSDLDIAHYLAYLPFKTEAKIVSAFFDAQTVVSYTQYSDRKPTLGVAGTVGMKTVKIDDKKGAPLVAFPRLSAEITSSDLMSATFNLSKLALESPEVNIRRDKRGDVNVKELVPEEIADELVQLFRKIREILTFAADEIAVTGAVVRLSDAYPSGGFQSTLSDVDLRIDHFSNSPDELSELTFSMKTEAGESLSASAEFSVDPLIVEATVELAGLKLKKYEPYYRDLLRTKLENGVLGVTTALRFARIGDNLEMRITGLSAKLESLHLRSREEGGDLARLPEVLVKECDIDIIKQDVRIGEVSSRGGTVSATRASDGSVDLLNLIEYRVAQLEGSAGEAVPEEARKPWLVSVSKLSVDGYTIRAEDRVPEDPAVFLAEKVKVRGENISTARNSTGKISLSLVPNRRGLISLAGSLSIDPMTLNLTTDAKEVLIGPFQPYIDTFVRIIVTEGSVSAKGRLRASYSEQKGIFVDYKGEALISSFGSVDRENAEDLLKWQVLHLGGLSIISSPPAVTVTEAALNGFSGHLVMNEDRTLNVMNLMAGEKSGDAKPAEPPPQTAGSVQQRLIRIDTLTLQDGAVSFLDRSVKPHYATHLLEIGGRISGLSSEKDTLADVDLRGKHENHAPLEITGKINPLREDLFVDVKAEFKGMELSPVTPYSGRYLGYPIEKGKLTFSSKYHIVKNKLDSENAVFLDQLTLGEKIESPEATKLPVKLAIALLKNRKGEITLDLPVTGNIDDPKFSMGSIILKIILNLLVKAATSPFALLGAIFGGGEELSYVEFDSGSSRVSEQNFRKLDTLVKALSDRPGLKLEIEGYVDREKDRDGLRQTLFNRKIKAQKLKDMVKKGETPPPVDDVVVEKEEYPKYLKMAYKEEKFPKPRNFIGMAKDLPAPEMEKLMLTHTVVNDDDLRMLASQRALAVRDYILGTKKVEQERVFLVEPKGLEPEKKENLRDSRVVFKLK